MSVAETEPAVLHEAMRGSTLRAWVKQHDVDEGKGPADALTTDEKAELRKLRRENRRLREDREILVKAAAFFAKENG